MLGSRTAPSDCGLKRIVLAAGLGMNCRGARAEAKRPRQ